MKITCDTKAVGLADLHLDPFDKEVHPAYLAAKRFVLDYKPQILVFMGDTGEFASLSNWNKKKPLIAEGRRYKDDVNVVKDELYFWRYSLPDTKMVFLIGNHEHRARWYAERNPEMEGSLDIVRDLNLEDLEMTVVPFNKAYKIGHLWWAHGWYYNKYHAAKTLHEFGDNIVYAHVHSLQQETRNVHFAEKEQIAQSVGCLTHRYPDWKGGKPTRFQNGLAIVEYNNGGNFTLYPPVIVGGKFSYGGYTYSA